MTIATTNRLMLRRFKKADAPFLLTLMNEPSYHANIGDRGIRSVSEAEDYFETVLNKFYVDNGFGLYLVTLKEAGGEGVPIGMCGLVNRDGLDGIDLGYALLPSYWGKGYAKEACLAVMHHAQQDFALTELWAIVSKHNEASAHLLLRLGFIADGTFLHGDSDTILDLYRCNLS